MLDRKSGTEGGDRHGEEHPADECEGRERSEQDADQSQGDLRGEDRRRGFSTSAFDKVAVSADQRPADLVPIPWDKLQDAPDVPDLGDFVFQVCADSAFITEHALRRIEHALGSQV